ncbi:MAG: hypothetical protein ACKOEO_14470, partial [Planctomycetaceae bacterium]
ETGRLRILDVGCGDGLLFPSLAGFGRVFGVEADETTLAADSPNTLPNPARLGNSRPSPQPTSRIRSLPVSRNPSR